MSSPTDGRGPNPAGSRANPVVTSPPSTTSHLALAASALASVTATATDTIAAGTSIKYTPNRASSSSAGHVSGTSASSTVSIISFDQPLPESYVFEGAGPSPSASSIGNRDGSGGLSALIGGRLRNGSPSPFRGAASYPPPTIASRTATTTTTGPNDDVFDDELEDHSGRFGIETRSLSPSLREHVIENGRSYHAYKAGKYPLPNDLDEQERDYLKHELTLLLCRGRYYDAPIKDMLIKGAEVLDLGTGTGMWCIKMADMYENSTFTGIDLSPIQPEEVPVNVQFIVDDIEHEAGWDYPENYFDYIHIRHVMFSIRDKQMVMERAFRHLKPGGWLELQEWENTPHCDDGSVRDDEPYLFRDFCQYTHDGLRRLGLTDSIVTLDAQKDLGTQGFVDLFERVIKCPIGTWPMDQKQKSIGELKRQSLLEGLDSISRRSFTGGLNWTSLQLEMFLLEVRHALSNPDYHVYFRFQTVYGRKPLPPKA